jgi:hypothetical protein
MIRKSPQYDTENPPGQIVNPIKPSHLEKPLEQNIKDFLVDTEEMFTPVPDKRCEKMGSLPCGPSCCKDTEKGVNNSVP